MAKEIIVVPKGIGPRFSDDLRAAGIADKRIVVNGRQIINYEGDPNEPRGLTIADVATLNTVIDNHDPLLPALPNEEMQRKEQIVDYAQSLIDMTAQERDAEHQLARYRTFLETIVDLSVEAL
jgi:hypothetical protein